MGNVKILKGGKKNQLPANDKCWPAFISHREKHCGKAMGPVRTYFPKQPTVVVTTTPYVKTMFLGAQGTPTHCSWVRRNTADIFVFPSCLETWWDFDMLNVDCLETWQDLSPWPSASNTASKCPGSFGGEVGAGFEWKITVLDSDLPLPVLKEE